MNLTARERRELERLARDLRVRCVAGTWRGRDGAGIDMERTYSLHRLLRSGVSLVSAIGATVPGRET